MKAGTTDFAALDDFNLGHAGAVEGEHTLNAFAIGDTADGEGLAEAGTIAGDHDAGEDLDTLLVTFDHSRVNFDGIAGAEFRDILFDLVLLDLRDDLVHDSWRVKIQPVPDWSGRGAANEL